MANANLPIDKTPLLKIDINNIDKLQADARRLRELREARDRLRHVHEDVVNVHYVYREYGDNKRDSFNLSKSRVADALAQEIQALEQVLLAYGVGPK